MAGEPRNADALAAIDLRRPDNAPLVLIDKLQLIERLIGADPKARVVVVTAQAEVAAAIEDGGGRLRRYLADPAYAEQLGLGAAGRRDRVGTDDGGNNDSNSTLREIEWRHIQRVLELNKGNKAATARALKIHLSTLKRKLARAPRTA